VAWLPALLWRFDKNWKALRATTPWVDRLPSEIVADHILFSTQPIEEPENPKDFHAAMSMFDARRMLMFASDYPHWDGDTPDFTARLFAPELRRNVLAETARQLYRLPARPTLSADKHGDKENKEVEDPVVEVRYEENYG
jgi:predicted TIM-barrel fold metal-dependent hydrolase